MPALAEFQTGLAAALLDPDAPMIGPLGPGIAVHQNTVTRAMIDVLRANYPTVVRLVGGEWFDSAARLYSHEHLPVEPALALYGESFAHFLRGVAALDDFPFVPHVARLDRLWSEAYFAADGEPLFANRLSEIPPAQLQSLHLQLHPSTRYAWLPHSAVTIWSSHRPPAMPPNGLEISGGSEGVLITRPDGEVRISRLSAAGFLLLQCIDTDALLGDAAVAVLEHHPETELSAAIAALIAAGAFSRPPHGAALAVYCAADELR